MRNVVLLFFCEAGTRTSSIAVLSSMALIGSALTSYPYLATLPLAIIPVTTMIMTVPAAWLMQRYGRRFGFSLGAILGFFGGLICSIALWIQNFKLLCIGAAFIGSVNGFATFYRFAGGEVVPPNERNRAISLVMAGGIVAAFAGANIAISSRSALGPHPFIGTYLSIAGLQLIVLLIVSRVRFPKDISNQERKKNNIRSLKTIAGDPRTKLAVLGAVTCWAIMSLLMNATPLSMQRHMHSFEETAWVIQWHVLGMFAPSFFTGNLINRFGTSTIMTTGTILLVISIITNLCGTQFIYFLIGLTLLGLGWNFLFVTSTTLLATTYEAEEKGRVQAANDSIIYGILILTTFGSAPLEEALGWHMLNLAILPIIAVSSIIMFKLNNQIRQTIA